MLITGAAGFIGQTLTRAFLAAGWAVHATSRRTGHTWAPGVRSFAVAEAACADLWQAALQGVDVVVHCAARVHVMREQAAQPLTEFRKANVDATLALAQAAQAAGVRRFIFLSTVGVHGACTAQRPFKAEDAPAPHSAYAQSKLEAENALAAWAASSGIELVCIRPPLVHGPHAPGNFGRLLRLVRRRFPLPLGSVHNHRSMVSVENLSSLVLRCADHPAAAGRTWLVSDGEDLSTTALLKQLSRACGHEALLLPVPVALLRVAMGLLGKGAMAEQLLGTLQVDITETCQALDWRPPQTVAAALQAAASAENRTDTPRPGGNPPPESWT